MDTNALAVLDFPAIAERLAAVAATAHGEELARGLAPSPDPDEVARRQALTAEVVALLDEAAEPPLDGIRDIREAAAHAARGGALSTQALAHIAAAIGGGLRTRAALDEVQETAPLLTELAAAIEPGLAPLAKEIGRRVEEDGSDLRDNASPLLRKLRRELRDGRQKVTEELRRLSRAPGLREHLQEDFVALRGGRPVLAVKLSARRSVKGIVHDSSGSGQTLFVEPFEVVELNNRQSEAAGDEREEVERILRELSAAVAEKAAALAALVEATGAIDLAVACGTVSRRWRGTPVQVSDEVRLLGARHPLLDPATAVPIDLDLGDLRALVVSGPNTGGKTVALKTLGLAALLHQSGLRPPAVTAALPVFDEVLADIGDPQSIEMSLSTFSGHIENVRAILRAATGALARPRRRARLRHRSRRGLRARAGAPRPPRRSGAADGRHDALPGAEGVGERDGGRGERGDRARSRDARAALPDRTRAAGHLARAADGRAARPRRVDRRRRPRPRRAGAAADRRAARRGRGGGASGGGGARGGRARARGGAARSASRRASARRSSRRRSSACGPRRRRSASSLSPRRSAISPRRAPS